MGDHNDFFYNLIDTVTRSWKPSGYQSARGIDIGGFNMAVFNNVQQNTILNCASAGIVHVNGPGSTGNYIENNIVVNCGTDLDRNGPA